MTFTDDLYWLTLVTLLTGLLWVPYILQLIVQLGPVAAVWDPTGAHPHDADWALRAKRALKGHSVSKSMSSKPAVPK